MTPLRTSLAALFAAVLMTAPSANAEGKKIAASWKTFQEERWRTDEKAIMQVVQAAGDTFISTDAEGSSGKQAADIDKLIAQKPDVILVAANDSEAILPSIKKINDAGIKTIAYDVQFEDPNALYITFDNIGVGRMMAQEIAKAKPEGNYAFIKGDKGDPNSAFVFKGISEVLKPAIESGKIKNVCEAFTAGWSPENARREMDRCLEKQANKIDAVVSENDGMASGVVAALKTQGLARDVPVSGQDGELSAINRIGLGTQTVSVWKDSRQLGKAAGEAAVALADGKTAADLPGVQKFKEGKNGVEMNAILLAPTPITRETMNLAIDAGWISKERACSGVKRGTVKACG